MINIIQMTTELVPREQIKALVSQAKILTFRARCKCITKKYPEFESQSLSQHWYFLNRFLSYMNPDQDACSITYEQYRSDKFIIGISFEKMSEAHMTGINTKMSGLTTLKLKPYRTLRANEAIEEVLTHIISESVLEIRSDGSAVYD